MQLYYEVEQDSKFQQVLTKIAGDAGTEVTLTAAKKFNSDPGILPKLTELASEGSFPLSFPKALSLKEYLHQHPNTLPRLPSIRDVQLEKRVFAHIGTVEQSKSFESYERLEYVGDSCIEFVARRLVYHFFPYALEGKMSRICQELVCNETLSKYSCAYGLDERLQLPSNYFESGAHDFSQKFTKLCGDIFEAYCAAVVEADTTNGFQVIRAWLECLWKPILLKHQNKVQMDPDAKVKLMQKLGGKGIKVEFVDEGEKPEKGLTIYSIGVYITGWGWQKEHLGTGTGESKKEAGMWAATHAVTNPTTAVINAVKKQFDAQMAKERAREGGPDPKRVEMLEQAYKSIKYGF